MIMLQRLQSVLAELLHSIVISLSPCRHLPPMILAIDLIACLPITAFGPTSLMFPYPDGTVPTIFELFHLLSFPSLGLPYTYTTLHTIHHCIINHFKIICQKSLLTVNNINSVLISYNFHSTHALLSVFHSEPALHVFIFILFCTNMSGVSFHKV